MPTQQSTGNILPSVSPFDTKSLQDQVTPIDVVDLTDYWRGKQMELSNKNLELQNKKILVDLEEAKARQKLYDKQLRTQNKAAAKELIKYHRELGGDTITADTIYMLPKELQTPLLNYQNQWAQIANMGENLNFDPDALTTAANQLLTAQASDPKYREAKNFLNAYADLRKKVASPKYQIDEMLYNDFTARLAAGEVKNTGEFNEKNFIIDDKYIQGLGKEVVKQIKAQKYVVPKFVSTGGGRGYWEVTENKASKEGIYSMIQENLTKDPGANRYAELTAKSLNLENRGTSDEPITKESVLKQIADQVTAGVFTLSIEDLTNPTSVEAKGFVNPSSGGAGGNFTFNIPNPITGKPFATEKGNTETPVGTYNALNAKAAYAETMLQLGLNKDKEKEISEIANNLTNSGTSVVIKPMGGSPDGSPQFVTLEQGTFKKEYITETGKRERAKFVSLLESGGVTFGKPDKDYKDFVKYFNDPDYQLVLTKTKDGQPNYITTTSSGVHEIIFKATKQGVNDKRIRLSALKANRRKQAQPEPPKNPKVVTAADILK